MAKVTVTSGICGFKTIIETEKNAKGTLDVKFRSGCPNYKSLEETLTEVNPMVCLFQKIGTGDIYDQFRPLCPHISCPVVSATMKAIEVGYGFALPKDVEMKIEK